MAKDKEGEMDEDTKEILAEMEADGIDTSSLNGGKRVDPKAKEEDEEGDNDSSQEDEEDEAEAGSKEGQETEEETEEEEEADEDSADDDSEDDDDAEGEEDEDTDEEEEPEGKGKKGKLTLVQKYRREKKLRIGAQAALETLKNAKSDEAFDAELKTFAEKNNLSLDVAKGLVDFAARKAGLPKDVLADIQRSRTEQRDKDYWNDQHKGFNTDFTSNVIPALQSLGLDKSKIESIYKTLNEDEASPFWAWNKKNKSQSLVKLALSIQREGGKKGNRTSSESTRGGLNRGKSQKENSDLTPDDINDMSDAEFDKFSDDLGKNSKSVVHRS